MSKSLTTITIPKKIIDKAKELKIDVESIAIEAILRELKLNPNEEAEAHLELAKKYMDEAKIYMEKGDAIQSSEKFYKVVEECIKTIAQQLNIPEVAKAKKYGRWFTWLLDKAARRIARELNEYRVKSVWDAAYSLHIWGFHESKLNINDIKIDTPHIEWLLKYTEKLIKRHRETTKKDKRSIKKNNRKNIYENRTNNLIKTNENS